MTAEHAQLIEARWEATGGNNPLRRYGDFQGVYDSIPFRQRLVEPVNGAQLYVVCIDERLIGSSALPINTANYARMAGEGILNPQAEEDLKRAKTNGIIAHRGCGAKGIFAQGQEGNPDEVGLVAVYGLADRAGIPVVQTISPNEFRTSLHDARAIYYDGTEGGRFDWGRVENFPLPGFIVSRGILSDPSYAQTEVSVAVGIAQGDHGFGRKFSEKSPLHLVAITDNQLGSIKTEVLQRELLQVAAKNEAVTVNLVLTS